MIRTISRLLCTAGLLVGAVGACAQTIQPGVLNGITVWLGAGGTATVSAATFLTDNELLVCESATPLIERFQPFVPLGSAPSAAAAPQLMIDCDDPVSFQVLVWIPQFGAQWHAITTYLNVGGYANCDCSTDCPFALLLHNGLAGSPTAAGDSRVLARDFVIDPAAYPGWQFAFSTDPLDSLRTYPCGPNGLVPVTIYGFPPAGPPTIAETYFLPAFAETCATTAPASLRVIHGLAAGLTVDRSFTARARAFVSPARQPPGATYAFSPDPSDSLLRLDCGAVDTLTRVAIYEFGTTATAPARSYLFLTDLLRRCAPAPAAPPNDSIERAFLLNPYLDCPYPVLGTTAGATVAENEDYPQSTGGVMTEDWDWGPAEQTVWYRFTNNPPLRFTGQYELTIVPQDSLQVAIYPAQSAAELPPANEYALIAETVADTVQFVVDCAFDFGYGYFLQLDGVNGRPARFAIRLSTLDICSPAAEAYAPSGLLMYPNPATDRLRVETPTGIGIALAQWYEVSGRALATAMTPSPTGYEFRLGNWPPGIYLLRLRLTNGQAIIRRIVKQ